MILSMLAAATAATAMPLEPTGKWVVRAEESLCLLERTYGTGPTAVTLVFQPWLDLPNMEMFVLAADASTRQYVGTHRMRVNDEPYTGSYLSVFAARPKIRITRLGAQRAMLEGLKDGDVIAIDAKPISQSFRIVRPDAARAALAQCVAVLMKEWGIDPDRNARIKAQLEGNPAAYFGEDAYPKEALERGAQGRVVALLTVDDRGAVSGCRILSSAGLTLNDGTCKAALRVRFRPARGHDDKPIASTYILPVRWVLPSGPLY